MAELISIIIPAYNSEEYIERCIRSIQRQTYRETEIIVVNDGSADATERIGREVGLCDPRVKVLTQGNCGVSAARNRGLDAARGDYISFVDADDTLPPNALELLLENMQRENADIVSGTIADIVGGRIRAINANSEEKEEAKSVAEIWSGRTALEKSLEDNVYTYSVCGKLFTKRFIQAVRFVEGRKVHEDSFFLFECFENEPKMVCVNECVYEYHIMQGSASRSEFSEKYFDILYFAERKYEVIQSSYPEYIKIAKNMIVKANMAILKILSREKGNRYRNEEKKCIERIKAERKYFIAATKADKIWFFIIQCNLYLVYKLFYKVKAQTQALRSKS